MEDNNKNQNKDTESSIEDTNQSQKKKGKKSQKTSSPEASKTAKKRKRSSEDNGEWDKLYEFLRSNILNYPETQPLSRYCCMRLKGISADSFWVPENQKNLPKAYSYEIVRKTLEQNARQLQWSIKHNTFNNDAHRVNYIMKVIESHIVDVALDDYYKKQEEKIDLIRHDNLQNVIDDIKKKQDQIDEPRLKSNQKEWQKKYDNLW